MTNHSFYLIDKNITFAIEFGPNILLIAKRRKLNNDEIKQGTRYIS